MSEAYVPELRGKDKMPDMTGTTSGRRLVASRAAVIVIDMINWQVSPEGGLLSGLKKAGADTGYIVERVNNLVIPNLRRLLASCRKAGVKVIYTRVGCYRPDFSDALPAMRPNIEAANAVDGTWACEVVGAIKPEPGDTSLLKTGSGSFMTSALDIHLRNMGITDLLYTGVVTNGCVMLTAGGGLDLGYRGFLVSDCTATFSQRLQDISEELITGYMATAVSTEEVLAQLQQQSITA